MEPAARGRIIAMTGIATRAFDLEHGPQGRGEPAHAERRAQLDAVGAAFFGAESASSSDPQQISSGRPQARLERRLTAAAAAASRR